MARWISSDEQGAPSMTARTEATVAVARLILANKPLYPFYVLWIAGAQAALASGLTMVPALFYVAVLILARRKALLARLVLVCGGLADTLFATKLFGATAGTEAFLTPCALLAFACFSPQEARVRRALVGVIFVAFLALHGRYGEALNGLSPMTAESLFALNVYSAAGLTFFIVWRFSRL